MSITTVVFMVYVSLNIFRLFRNVLNKINLCSLVNYHEESSHIKVTEVLPEKIIAENLLKCKLGCKKLIHFWFDSRGQNKTICVVISPCSILFHMHLF